MKRFTRQDYISIKGEKSISSTNTLPPFRAHLAAKQTEEFLEEKTFNTFSPEYCTREVEGVFWVLFLLL